eukprot:m.346326 g.346326  ORF g.346326 m.346326 type:complete len:81 (-) comp20667_c0_seq4:10349-10591(-)
MFVLHCSSSSVNHITGTNQALRATNYTLYSYEMLHRERDTRLDAMSSHTASSCISVAGSSWVHSSGSITFEWETQSPNDE